MCVFFFKNHIECMKCQYMPYICDIVVESFHDVTKICNLLVVNQFKIHGVISFSEATSYVK